MLTSESVDGTALWWQLGSIAGVIGTFVILYFLLYTIINYFRIFQQHALHHVKYQSKTIYLLSIIYFIFGLFTCCIYSLIQSNMITRIQSDDFSLFQCQFGYLSGLSCYALNRIFFYLVILKRIKMSFKGTIYEYHSISFLCLYWVLSIITTLNFILWIIAQRDSQWMVISNTTNTISFCSIYSGNIPSSSWINIGKIVLMLVEIMFKFYLLYLMWNGLFKIYKTLAIDVAVQNHNCNSHKIKINSPQHKQLKALCELVKKQTILLFFGVCFTFLYYLIAALSVEQRMESLLCYDCLMNSICVWLMFQSTSKVWNCCIKFGVCCCCYFSQNMDLYLSEAIK